MGGLQSSDIFSSSMQWAGVSKKISKYNFDTGGFPKSRSLRQLIFYLTMLEQ